MSPKALPHTTCTMPFYTIWLPCKTPNLTPVAKHGGSLYHFYNGLRYDLAEAQTNKLLWYCMRGRHTYIWAIPAQFLFYSMRNLNSARWQYLFVGFITHRSVQSEFFLPTCRFPIGDNNISTRYPATDPQTL